RLGRCTGVAAQCASFKGKGNRADTSVEEAKKMGPILAQTSGNGGGGSALIGFCVLAAFAAIFAGQWKTFTKAGEHGWAAIVPIYNAIVLLRVAKMSSSWIWSIFFYPVALIVFWVVAPWKIGEAFGKSPAFRLCLILVPF